MTWGSGHTYSFVVDGVQLEGKSLGPSPSEAETIILLHEGLGSIELWRDFPDKLAAATGLGVFLYSRQGYGRSDPVTLPRPLDYMNVEAERVLPKILTEIGFKSGYLLGHSDGASIAAIYGGLFDDDRIKGIVLMAPHFFAEDISVDAIADVNKQFVEQDLRRRLSKYHADVDGAFRGWCESWLNPEFRHWNIECFLSKISKPILAIQGSEDEYGTMRQMDSLKTHAIAPLQIEIIDGCGHSPQIQFPEEIVCLINNFIK
ncbi:MAG: alpha/beta hydrolase [Sneathiella sp.]|nr:alpha/beta hydrolase [Sneathiella sp.]